MKKLKFSGLCILDDKNNILFKSNKIINDMLEMIKIYLATSFLLKNDFKQSSTVLNKNVFYILKKSLIFSRYDGKFMTNNEEYKNGQLESEKFTKDIFFIAISDYWDPKYYGKIFYLLQNLSSKIFYILKNHLRNIKEFDLYEISNFFCNNENAIISITKKFIKNIK